MDTTGFVPQTLNMASGLASRRGGQSIKPLSFDALKSAAVEGGAPTPRSGRAQLLDRLRTAPKSATVGGFPASPTTVSPAQARNKNAGYAGQDFGPKTSMPRFAHQSRGHVNNVMPFGYTVDQVLPPPDIAIDETEQAAMDPSLYQHLVNTNLQLAQQQQRLQQHLLSIQQAAQQLQGLSIQGQPQQIYQAAYQQQYPQQMQQQQVYAVINPLTGQPQYFVDQAVAPTYYADANLVAMQLQQQQLQQQIAQHAADMPRVQVSPPPPAVQENQPTFRNTSPPRSHDLDQHAPLPPPSANAFRRGHKKSSSFVGLGATTAAGVEPPKSAGPKSATFPASATGGYGPGQGRAGEHPIRQPRGPPALDELKAKPTSRHEGSKNFVTRTRRSAIGNLVRAGLERRKGSGSSPGSSGSISPISESADEASTPLTDNESDSGRSGSGSLQGDDVECGPPSSRTSTGSWGAIGSDRPSSREAVRKNDEMTPTSDDTVSYASSFASVFKNGGKPSSPEAAGRKAPMLVLTSAEKRKQPFAV